MTTIEELIGNFKELRRKLEVHENCSLEFLTRATIMTKTYQKEKRDKMLGLDSEDKDYQSKVYAYALVAPELFNFPLFNDQQAKAT